MPKKWRAAHRIAIVMAMIIFICSVTLVSAEVSDGSISTKTTTDYDPGNDTVITDTPTIVPADEQNERFDRLKFDDSQKKVVIQGEFSIKDEKQTNNVPIGSVIYHSKKGITRVFDKDGKQLLIANDADSTMIQTPQGKIPATYVFSVPNSSLIYNNGEYSQVILDDKLLYTVVSSEGTDSSIVPGSGYYEWFEEANSTHIDNLGTFIADWDVPAKPTNPYHNSQVFLFNGIMPQNAPLPLFGGGTTLIQPVLEWNNGGGPTPQCINHWCARPWVITNNGNSFHSDTPIEVDEQHHIKGVMDWSISKQAWEVGIRDDTIFQSIFVNDTGGGGTKLGTYNLKVTCALEGHNVIDRTDLPGSTTFHDMVFLDSNSNPVSFTWNKYYNSTIFSIFDGLYVDTPSQSQVTLYTDKTYTISPTAGPGGSTSPSGPTPYLAGSNPSVSIMPINPPYMIGNVLVDGVSVGSPTSYTFTNIQADHTLSANFIRFFIITPSSGIGGSVLPSSAVSVPQGGFQTFNITPNNGYQIDNVVVSGVSKGAISSYNFTNVQTSNTISATFKPSPLPLANFTANHTLGQAPFAVAFTDNSTGNPTKWNWSFGDSTTSTDQNPVHVYTTDGSFTVSLNATNDGGSNISTKTGYICTNCMRPVPPVADLTVNVTSGRLPLTVAFFGKTVGGPTNTWLWNFGDGQNSILQNPVHQYNSKGNYSISLTIKNTAGTSTRVLPNWIRAGFDIITVNNTQNNSTISVARNTVIRLGLTQCNSCGYEWSLTTTPGLNVINTSFLINPALPGINGGSGQNVWDITAVGIGEQNITAVYKRPGIPLTGNEQIFRLNITVNRESSKIGTVRNNNTWLLDVSGNGAYGAGDLTYAFGKASDTYVTGDWNNDRKTEIGVFRDNTTWLLDTSGNGAWGAGDTTYTFGTKWDIPVTGDWNGDGKTEIGVFRNKTTWLLDTSGNGAWGTGDTTFAFGTKWDIPVTGDWNGDGKTEIGVFRNKTTWLLDTSSNGAWGAGDTTYTFGTKWDIPVAGDWNRNGKTEIGVFRNSSTWLLDYNGNGIWNGISIDRQYNHGLIKDIPVTGNW